MAPWFSACRPQEATAEVTRDEPTVNQVTSVNDLLLIVAPIAGEYVGPLQQQPSLMAVDEQVRQRCQNSTHKEHKLHQEHTDRAE